MVKSRFGLAVLVVVAVAVLAAPAAAVDGAVGFRFASYTPSQTRITPGGTVTFTADAGNDFAASAGEAHHPLHFVNPAVGNVTSGTTAAKTFATPGIYRFYCGNHGFAAGDGTVSGMSGQITVSNNQLPTASFVVPATVTANQNISLDATTSHDPDGVITAYRWDFDNDGAVDEIDTHPATSHPFRATATVSLTVVDNNSDAVGPEASGPVTQVVTVTPGTGTAPGTNPGPTQPATPRPPVDRTAPKVVLSTHTLHLSALRGGRAKVSFTSSEPGAANATLKAGSTIVATGRTTYSRSGAHSLTFKLTNKGRAKLRHAKHLSLKLSLLVADVAGNRASKTLSLGRVS